MSTALPQSTLDILAAKPKRGDGLNQWCFSSSLALRRCGRSERDMTDTLRTLTAGDAIKPGEIERAVKRSADFIKAELTTGSRLSPPAKWPTLDRPARQRVIAQYDDGAVEFWEQSPYPLKDDAPLTEEIIDALFPGNPLICVATALENATTGPRESFRGRLADMQFIVPSSMSKPVGLTQDGRVSARCLDNVGRRRYIVVEQDDGTADEQAAVITHLAERAPLTLVVRSGGKSLHSWFYCGSEPEAVISRFFRYAVSLGADRALWTPCQLCRMPDGLRRKPDGQMVRQSVLYWNPANTEVSR